MLENKILSQLLTDDIYLRKVIIHLDTDYFENANEQIVCKLITDYFQKYNKAPTKSILETEIESRELPENIYDSSILLVKNLKDEVHDNEWLIDKTEEFCKERALNNALFKSVELSESDEKNKIPEILSKALGISFDNDLGHDYIKDAEKRFKFYNTEHNKIPFDIDLLNKITKNGVTRKTFNCLMAPTGKGKSLALCHMAAAYRSSGYNVLYISHEMSEEWISRRIDANYFDIDINDVEDMEYDKFMAQIKIQDRKSAGVLKVKEYPTGTAHVGHIRHLISEYKMKENFVPDVIIIDYINIMCSYKMKNKGDSYGYIKSIAEEVRGLFVELDVVGWSATQVNREGVKASDFDMGETSESMGLVHTLDLFLGMMATEELEAMGLVKFKQLKNRYGALDYYSSFVVGIDKPKMRLFDADDQGSITKEPNDSGHKQNRKDKLNSLMS
ncbi:MAG: DNA primase [Hyphomicrobiales bacterium]|nr:MAG: DNA primase [Hyphomicrobiales bacterium]